MQSPHARFIAPARARPQLWRLALGIVLCAVSSVLGAVLVFGIAIVVVTPPEGGMDWAARMAGADTPAGTLLVLAAFLGMGAGAMLAARWLHRRPARSLFGPRVRVLRDFVIAFAIVGSLMAVSLLFWSITYDAVPNLAPGRWLALLPLTVLALLIQTGAEELLFRGYLQQQLAARFSSAAVWMVLPAIAFGLLHLNPDLPGQGAWMIVGAAAAFGLAAADLTARTGSIGAAWGFHFANNLMAIGILSTEGTITGISLFRTPYGIEETATLDALILLDLGFLALAWWLVRRAVVR